MRSLIFRIYIYIVLYYSVAFEQTATLALFYCTYKNTVNIYNQRVF